MAVLNIAGFSLILAVSFRFVETKDRLRSSATLGGDTISHISLHY